MSKRLGKVFPTGHNLVLNRTKSNVTFLNKSRTDVKPQRSTSLNDAYKHSVTWHEPGSGQRQLEIDPKYKFKDKKVRRKKEEYFIEKHRMQIRDDLKQREKQKQMKALKKHEAGNLPENRIDIPISVQMLIEKTKGNHESNEIYDQKHIESRNKKDLLSHLDNIDWDVKALLNRGVKEDIGDIKSTKTSVGGFNPIDDSKIFVEEIDLESSQIETSDKIMDFGDTYDVPDPDFPASTVDCYGCGARLHCIDRKIPGYIPSPRFKILTTNELKRALCKRCQLIKHHDSLTEVDVPEDPMTNIYKEIRIKKSLVLHLVDLLDIKNTIMHNSRQLFGKNTPVYIIGNKVDMIPNDGSTEYLESLKRQVEEFCYSADLNVQRTFLVSGKTGYGIENLITTIMGDWNKAGKQI